MEEKELVMLQHLPLEVKVKKSKQRIREWINYYGRNSVYASFSGGVGSTVLYFLIKEIENEDGVEVDLRIPFLFVNTRNEYPEVVRHVYSLKGQNNEKFKKIVKLPYNDPRNVGDTIEIRVSKEKQSAVLKKHGYLVISKRLSREIMDCQNLKAKYPDSYKTDPRYLSKMDIKNRYSIPKRWQYLVDAPFKISKYCCHALKHSIFQEYERETERIYPITGEQASESRDRKKSYLQFGCNGFNRKKPKSMPLAFWKAEDLLEYIAINRIPYAACYGDIVKGRDGKYQTTKEKRTGCMFCTAGIFQEELEVGLNRFQRMQGDYPVHYELLMRPVEQNGLGVKEVLSYIGIKTSVQEELSIEELIELFG